MQSLQISGSWGLQNMIWVRFQTACCYYYTSPQKKVLSAYIYI